MTAPVDPPPETIDGSWPSFETVDLREQLAAQAVPVPDEPDEFEQAIADEIQRVRDYPDEPFSPIVALQNVLAVYHRTRKP